jgi:hypothetical protein
MNVHVNRHANDEKPEEKTQYVSGTWRIGIEEG